MDKRLPERSSTHASSCGSGSVHPPYLPPPPFPPSRDRQNGSSKTEKLGHPARGAFPPQLPLRSRGLALADPQGRRWSEFRRLLVDFELRSIIDRAWTFCRSTARGAEPLRFELGLAGRHNFSRLLDRLANDTPDEETGSLPRFVVQKISDDGDIQYADSSSRNP